MVHIVISGLLLGCEALARRCGRVSKKEDCCIVLSLISRIQEGPPIFIPKGSMLEGSVALKSTVKLVQDRLVLGVQEKTIEAML